MQYCGLLAVWIYGYIEKVLDSLFKKFTASEVDDGLFVGLEAVYFTRGDWNFFAAIDV